MNINKWFVFSFLLYSIVCNNSELFSTPLVKQGHVNLEISELTKKNIPLNGEWLFYEKQFINPIENNRTNNNYVIHTIPLSWTNQKMKNGNKYPAEYHGTYIINVHLDETSDILGLKISDIGSSSVVFIDDKKLSQFGTIGTSYKSSNPYWKQGIIIFKPENNTFTITIQVSNYHYSSGGIWNPILIGIEKNIISRRFNAVNTDFFLAGALLIMSFYHFALYLMRKKAYENLLYSLFSMIIVVRIFVTGEMYLLDIFPGINWNFVIFLSFFTMIIPIPIFSSFISRIYSNYSFKKVNTFIVIISLVISFMIMITPLRIYSKYITALQISVLAGSMYIFIVVFRAVLHKEKTSYLLIFGIAAMLLAIINDILHTNGVINTGFYTAYGLLVFIFLQSIILAFDYSKAYLLIEAQKNFLATTNEAYSRFVPREFLIYLKKSSIVDINLGDNVIRTMSVLFSDIRDFTTLSEQIGQQETFNFLNSYLSRIGPIIRKNGGFIDKYIGDGIMALFPDDPFIAIKAAVEIQKEIEFYNFDRSKSGYLPIAIGVGINSGSMMLGTIGEFNRMDSTVISDTVNIASRIEGLTKLYGCGIIISSNLLENEKISTTFEYRLLDSVKVKGKSQPVTIVEILDGLPDDQLQLKLQTRKLYEEGIYFYQNKEIDKAVIAFEKVASINPFDKAPKLFIERCKRVQSLPASDDKWDWVTIMETK